MPTRVLLEGPAIEPLLAQVRQEYGSSVRIISADKVRTGGFGGFFAKQRYELSVEVPDQPEQPEQPATRSDGEPAGERAPQTLDQLLEQMEAQDRFAAATPQPAAGAQPAADRPTTQVPATAAAALPPRAGLVSTNGAAFAEVMAGLNAVGVEPVAARLEPAVQAAGPAVRAFRPPTVTGTPVNAGAPAAAADQVAMPTATATAVAAPAAVVAPAQVAVPAPGAMPVSGAVPPVPAGYVPPAAPVVAPVRPADPLVADLVALGMPESIAVRVTGTDAYTGILAALADLPAAPPAPDRAGEVLVIAGELAHTLPVARRVAEQLRLDVSRVLLAGPSAAGTGIHPARKISGPAQAEKKARRMHRADTPWVVVLDAPVTNTNAGWVNDVCDALGATAVWAVVDATRKTADTRRHLRAMGEVEAVAVYGAAVTADPASVFGLDLPMVSVDGQEATRHTWAALLCERLTADAAAVAGTNSGRRRRRGR